MNGKEIREKFIKFFIKNNHTEFKSSSLVPDDETLLFTTAGMVQMVPFLMREKEIISPRVCSVQKSFRTTDIDDIGSDGRHLTFFEMLGSWSFGDYYKKEAIELAYELLTEEFLLDKEKIWVSIFKGDKDIPKDSESYKYWLDLGLKKERIVELVQDNFWGPTGVEGPCGPSTEIYYDNGEELGCGREDCAPGCDCDRFLEIWNAGVFMEYYKDENGNFSKLPFTNVDTGAGLERLVMVLQDKKSVFDTDLFEPIVSKIKAESSKFNERSCRIIADHIRGISFIISDGIIPQNEHRGYILRRLIRKSLLHAKTLGLKDFFLSELSGVVIDTYSDVYPELSSKRDLVKKILDEEEVKFGKTLDKGLKRLDGLIVKGKISGDNMFLLHDTYGFNIDILRDILKEREIEFSEEDFYKKLNEQKDRSRISSSFTLGKSIEEEFFDYPKTKFIGYDDLRLKDAKVLFVSQGEDEVYFVLDQTPFYAEGGGQVGDRGIVLSNGVEIEVNNVKKTKRGVYIHFGKYKNFSQKLSSEDLVTCIVDKDIREKTSFNHTAVHLLNKAMKIILGDQVVQKGSFIDSEKIRFDFNFDRALSLEEIKTIEDLVNENILKKEDIEVSEKNFEDIKKLGIDLPFEDRYDKNSKLRVVRIGDFSQELCGGTHKGNTSSLGKFKITKQESVSKGIRRVRAVLEY